MRIGELAAKAGVSASRIRFYEAEGLLEPPARRANGYRSYGARDLKIIAFIERAQRLGFTLKDISAFLATPAADRDLVPRLREKLAEIDAHMAEARARRREIVALVAELSKRAPRQAG